MSSEVEICNMALSQIRAGSINNLSESSTLAGYCRLWYPISRDRCLREPWQFNHTIRALAVSTTEIFNWAYTYSYPIDCLKIHRMIGSFEEIPAGASDVASRLLDSQLKSLKNQRRQIPYEVFNFDTAKLIGSDQKELRIDFARKITDPNLMSDDFIIALAYLLASQLAIPIVGAELGRALRGESLSLYKEHLAAALANDLNDQYLEQRESDFITVRN